MTGLSFHVDPFLLDLIQLDTRRLSELTTFTENCHKHCTMLDESSIPEVRMVLLCNIPKRNVRIQSRGIVGQRPTLYSTVAISQSEAQKLGQIYLFIYLYYLD